MKKRSLLYLQMNTLHAGKHTQIQDKFIADYMTHSKTEENQNALCG